jgi:adenine-specific DNA-methyltransferase
MTQIKQLNLAIQKFASLLYLSSVENAKETARPLSLNMQENDCFLLRGDNFEALSCLVQDSANGIDFVYIDPPYNTGQKFIYSDNKRRSSSGLWGKHYDWVSFMLPRLVAARVLLKSHGVIAISIDDYEYANLKLVMDNVFGEENYISTLVVCRSKNGKGGKQHVAVNHEYVLLYGKTKNVSINGLAECESKVYNRTDEHGEYNLDGLFRKKGDASLREDRPNMYYPLYYSDDGTVFTERIHERLSECVPQDSKGIDRRWLWGVDKARQESWKLYASKKGVIYVKNYKTPNKRIKLRSILDNPNYLTDRATTELKNLYGEKIFETPKPLTLIKDLIDACATSEAVILDFFAGTGTTAEAAWELNKQDDGTRKVILVEQSQSIPAQHIAAKKGFQLISDITEFRLKLIHNRNPSYKFSEISV